jgi:sigma-B regulation protein RsbU (phosphoserine phosphatase)
MELPSSHLIPITNPDWLNVAERKLLDELERIVVPVARVTDSTLVYASDRAAAWLSSCSEGCCVRNENDIPECLAQPCRPGRICHSIEYHHGGELLGQIILCCRKRDAELVAAIDHVVTLINNQTELEHQEEMLLSELSASWESLTAVYEISSDFGPSAKPQELLERILSRAVSYRDGLNAVLWLEHDGMCHPLTQGLTAAEPRPRDKGLIGKVMNEHSGVIINGRSRIRAQADLEQEFQHACNMAVVPLTLRENSLGALAVWQEEKLGDFDSQDMRFLAALALQAAMVVENDRLYRSALENERLRQEIEIGSKIQQTLLLGQIPKHCPGVKIAAFTIPSQTIDGDFYDFTKPNDHCLDVIIGDVMGKGVPAALVGAATKSHFLRALSQLLSTSPERQIPEPREIVSFVHAEVIKQLISLESFVTLSHARFDLAHREASIVDCGHTMTVRYRRSTGECDLLKGKNLPIGFSERESYEQISYPLEPGDIYFFYSDGLTEATNAAGKPFGVERLVELIRKNGYLDPERLIETVHCSLVDFADSGSLEDDLTCVAVSIMDLEEESLVTAELNILSDLGNLAKCREFVREVCYQTAHSADEEAFISQLELAVNEAIANVMKHAYSGRPDQPIRLTAERGFNRVAVRIFHRGESFDPEMAAEPFFDGSKDGGFGIYIINHLIDEINQVTSKQGETCITLIKKFRRCNQMEATIENVGDVAVIVLPGDSLDAGNAKEFKRDVMPMLGGRSKVIFDMSGLHFVDSSGLGVVLSSLRQLNATGGDLKLSGMAKPVRALFELVRMHRIFDIYSTREEALAAFGA